MKKLFFNLSLFCILISVVFVNMVQSVAAAEIPNPSAMTDLGGLITKVSGLIPPLAILGFIGSVIYAGFTRMTAAGNAEKEAKSMKIAIAAATGFLIIALAPLIVRLVGSLLGIKTEIL